MMGASLASGRSLAGRRPGHFGLLVRRNLSCQQHPRLWARFSDAACSRRSASRARSPDERWVFPHVHVLATKRTPPTSQSHGRVFKLMLNTDYIHG